MRQVTANTPAGIAIKEASLKSSVKPTKRHVPRRAEKSIDDRRPEGRVEAVLGTDTRQAGVGHALEQGNKCSDVNKMHFAPVEYASQLP